MDELNERFRVGRYCGVVSRVLRERQAVSGDQDRLRGQRRQGKDSSSWREWRGRRALRRDGAGRVAQEYRLLNLIFRYGYRWRCNAFRHPAAKGTSSGVRGRGSPEFTG